MPPRTRHRRAVWRSVLVADTDIATGRYLGRTLPAEGFAVKLAGSGAALLDLVETTRPDAIVLGASLPDMTALDVIATLQSMMGPPLLMLLPTPIPRDVAMILDAGADDCLSKPFLLRELAARLRRLVRRRLLWRGMPSHIRTATLDLDIVRWRACVHGEEVRLSRTEQAVLKMLVEGKGEVVLYTDLLSTVWGSSVKPAGHRIRPVVRNLRHKLKLTYDGAVRLLAEPQFGYRLVIAEEAAFPRLSGR